MNKKRKQIIESREVSKLVTYSLGGYEQKVLIEGKSRKSPVVLFLHGGPGSPMPFSEGCRGMFPEFTDKAVMVYWDQLGCGINNREIDDGFHVDDFVGMTVDLIRELKKEFPENPLILFGVSWGSILAVRAAAEVPELIASVMTYGQVLHDVTFNEEVYAALEKGGLPAKERAKLEEMKGRLPHTSGEVLTVMNWIQKYTDGQQCKEGGNPPLAPVLMGILKSPDYRLRDFKAMVINGCRKNTSLITELVTLDLRDALNNSQVPCLILQGSTDLITPTKMVTDFVNGSANQNLRVRVIPQCGHIPNAAGMEVVLEELQVLTARAEGAPAPAAP